MILTFGWSTTAAYTWRCQRATFRPQFNHTPPQCSRYSTHSRLTRILVFTWATCKWPMPAHHHHNNKFKLWAVLVSFATKTAKLGMNTIAPCIAENRRVKGTVLSKAPNGFSHEPSNGVFTEPICGSLIKYVVELFCGRGQVSETLLARCGIGCACCEWAGCLSS